MTGANGPSKKNDPDANDLQIDSNSSANFEAQATLDSSAIDDASPAVDASATVGSSPTLGASDGASGANRGGTEPKSIGPYRFIRKLGEGGMGQVWLAEQTEPLQRQVALKLIKVGMYDDDVLHRFQSERQSLAMMDHPGIAKVFDAGATPDGQPYFVMEFVPGVPVTQYCDQKRLTIKQRLELFIKVCEGVQHAHQKAIIHRDLKPANILVTEVDGKPVPRIIDFGLAKAATPDLASEAMFTRIGSFVGTPGYMSPEQANSNVQDVDTRTDVYSLGVVLYVLLTGAEPFDPKKWYRQPLHEVLRQLREIEPPRPSTKIRLEKSSSASSAGLRGIEPKQLEALLHGDLDWITMKALEKDRSRRYGSPAELAADIGHYLHSEPVLAHPPSTAYRMQKYLRRHRVGVAVAAGLVLLLAGFAVNQAVQLRRITRERDRANRITDFMEGMFKVSDPSEARGNSITAREILDKTSKQIDAGLSKDPETQAQLMDVMGNVYQSLGLYPQAQPLLEQALEVERRVQGPKNPETLKAADDLAWVIYRQGRYPEAEKLDRETLDTCRQVLGPDHLETLTSMRHLAVILEDEGRYAEAEKMYRALLDIDRRVLGPEHPETLRPINDLALTLQEEGRYAESEKMYRDLLDTRRRVLGPEHPDTLLTINNLAATLLEEGRYVEAEKMDRELLDIDRRVLGPEHPETLRTIGNLALILQDEGRYAEAEKMYRELLDIDRRVLGPEHPNTLLTINNLATTLLDEGRYAEAEKMERELLDIQRRVLGPEHPNTLLTINNLAWTVEKEGRYAEAEKMYREVLDTQRRVLGPVHPDTVRTISNLAGTLAEEGRYAEAEKMQRDLLDTQRRVLGPEDPETAVSVYNLGGIAARQGHKDEAFALLRQAVDHGLPPRGDLAIDQDSDLNSLHSDPRFAALVAHAKERAAAQRQPQ